MKKKLFYGKEGDEIYYRTCKYLQAEANELDKQIEVTEMQIDKSGERWCNKKSILQPELREKCGKFCSDYNPCNGKNGKCRFLGKTVIETGNKFILKPVRKYNRKYKKRILNDSF